ncbi:SGNH/GDSL hydrolase family protein [Aliiroseovarius sp. S1339]|uniref:SGNH/GDSL hydrolase family protein n=1 Tax=Aliiroseovarius sp. S1339 TaxID=2936990 RepID=UPI0020BE4AB8|nr:SGNH/GDSL hydrolase family protein [Aliiroseovarius sp. S1339]MCK8464300.1 SGNH/GDSL hydrolase family protein [Aliiroseovarius sp. S1339]
MADRILKIALSPVLLAQALRVRKTAASLPEPPGPRAGQIGDGRPLRLAIIGDSSAAGVGATHQTDALSGHLTDLLAAHYTLDWSLHAKTGATTRSTLASWPEGLGTLDIALVVLGVNDVTRQGPLRRLLDRRAQLYSRLQQDHGAKRVLVTGIPPLGDFPLLPSPLRLVLGRQAQRFDAALMRQAQSLGVEYMPFDMSLKPEIMAPDGFHPGPTAYRHFADAVFRQIQHEQTS